MVQIVPALAITAIQLQNLAMTPGPNMGKYSEMLAGYQQCSQQIQEDYPGIVGWAVAYQLIDNRCGHWLEIDPESEVPNGTR